MKRARYCYPILLCVLLLCNSYVNAQDNRTDTTKKLAAPKFLQLNYEEDYRYLSDKNKQSGLWTKLKYITLFGKAYMTLGGEVRTRLEMRDHLKYGKANEDYGLDFQQRSRLWTDIRLAASFRLFGELQSGTTSGLDYSSSPVDNNLIEIHQAFAEYTAAFSSASKLFVRVGRQEIMFGKARLFDVRQPPNNRHAYDAARIGFKKDKWNFGFIAGAQSADIKGAFNDGTDNNFKFGAAHVSIPLGTKLPNSSLELLYIYTDRKAAANAHFNGHRNTLSARISGIEGGLNYDIEVIGQSGRTSEGRDVRAWYAGMESYYTFRAAGHPYIGARVDVGSGDKNSADAKDGAYDFLWSKGQSWVSDLGYTNIAAAGPSFGLKPTDKLSLDLTVQGLWRMSRQDGIYAMSGAAIRTAADGTSNYVGLRSVLRSEYQLNPFLTFGGYLNQTFKGAFLKQSAISTNMSYASLYATFRF